MIVGAGLFQRLFDAGVTDGHDLEPAARRPSIATGLNRALFVPFIDMPQGLDGWSTS